MRSTLRPPLRTSAPSVPLQDLPATETPLGATAPITSQPLGGGGGYVAPTSSSSFNSNSIFKGRFGRPARLGPGLTYSDEVCMCGPCFVTNVPSNKVVAYVIAAILFAVFMTLWITSTVQEVRTFCAASIGLTLGVLLPQAGKGPEHTVEETERVLQLQERQDNLLAKRAMTMRSLNAMDARDMGSGSGHQPRIAGIAPAHINS